MSWTRADVVDYRKRAQQWASRWALYDEHLTALCVKYPGHEQLDAVIAKVGLIQRAYEAGLERHIRRSTGNGVVVTAEAFYRNRRNLDRAISSLQRLGARERLGAVNLRPVLLAHAAVLAITSSATRNGNTLRSFASKYLHFHCPIVPIYDERACGTIRRREWYGRYDAPELASRLGVDMPSQGECDIVYARYCLRFLQMSEEAVAAGADVTVRKLDAYLVSYADKNREEL